MADRPRRWSTSADVEAKVRRAWTTGALLAAYGEGKPFPVIEVPLRGPGAGEIAADLGAAQQWRAGLERAAAGRFRLVHRPVGGRLIGRNEIPSRAVVSTFEEAWRLLGVREEVAAFDAVLLAVRDVPVARAWVLAHPRAAGALGGDWPSLLAARAWLDRHRGSGSYVREIDAAGVDTKFVERHRATLAGLLGVPGGSASFLEALGLRDRPARLRLRIGDDVDGVPAALTDLTCPVDELAALGLTVTSAVVVENEITFLSVPVPAHGVVVFGEGFRVGRLGRVPWLAGVPLHYWGDLDTHGFAILDQLRAVLPQTRSFLMDTATLLSHRERWGTEPSPTSAALPRLTDPERAVYDDLVTDRHADRVRLEQERVDWGWVLDRWPVDLTAGSR